MISEILFVELNAFEKYKNINVIENIYSKVVSLYTYFYKLQIVFTIIYFFFFPRNFLSNSNCYSITRINILFFCNETIIHSNINI